MRTLRKSQKKFRKKQYLKRENSTENGSATIQRRYFPHCVASFGD